MEGIFIPLIVGFPKDSVQYFMSSVLLNALGKHPDFQKLIFLHACGSGEEVGKSGKGRFLGLKQKRNFVCQLSGKKIQKDNISDNVITASSKSAAGLEPAISNANSIQLYPCTEKSNFIS